MRIEILSATDAATRERAREVRRRVFVEEQGVPAALEVDEHDRECPYLLARIDGTDAGAARYRETAGGFKIERVAVLAPYRGLDIGSRMVERIVSLLPASASIYVHAQASAVGFWERMGFAIEGEAFVEADIVHYKMVRSG